MKQKLDANSDEFINELESIKRFTDKVCKKFGFLYSPENGVKELIQEGLARNKIIYKKQFCPCFMVIGETKEEQDTANNRVCPCKPALEIEISSNGKCFCGIFCTPEYAKKNAQNNKAKKLIYTDTKDLTKDECEVFLSKKDINSSELEALLLAREKNIIEFNLVDTREWMDWTSQRIKGSNYLIPTTSFYDALEQITNKKDIPTVVYCYRGSRSAYCQDIMKDLGFKSISNLTDGFGGYQGEVISGE